MGGLVTLAFLASGDTWSGSNSGHMVCVCVCVDVGVEGRIETHVSAHRHTHCNSLFCHLIKQGRVLLCMEALI